MKLLCKQISGENAKDKKNAIAWDEDCKKAFNQMKEICTHTPILAYANFIKPFRVHMDASEHGLGVVLYQKQEDQTLRVIKKLVQLRKTLSFFYVGVLSP